MELTSARLLNFRNLEETEVSFSPHMNLFVGRNGQGKTNLLEALNYVSIGRSHRGGRNEDLIRLGADELHVRINARDDAGEPLVLEYGLGRGGSRRFRIDGETVRRRVDLVGRLPAVFFSPDSIGLVRGGPERRRRFADQGLSSIDREYLAHLQAYLRSLRQKARLLRDLGNGRVPGAPGGVRAELVAWNREMAPHAAFICERRAEYARWIRPHARRAYVELSGEDTAFEFVYRPNLAAAQESPASEVEESPETGHFEKEILTEFDYIVEDEIRRGRPLSGPHLDDFEVRLAGLDLRVFGSQGETRTAAVALILAQSDVVLETRNIRPVLFFDDIFSELDRERSRQLQEKSIREHQVFIATARGEDVSEWRPEGLRSWRVEQGRLESLA